MIENQDSEIQKDRLLPGLSFVIRARNEEKNVLLCLSSLVNAVKDLESIEIIFVEHCSTDKTFELAENYLEAVVESNVTIRTYQFSQEVCKYGDNKNSRYVSLAHYFNWCLGKATRNNVIKWDADFVANTLNLVEMINRFRLNLRGDDFSLWCTGETIFECEGRFFKKIESYYNEYRVFSKKSGFEWKDHPMGELPTLSGIPLIFKEPVFYEIKRTSLNEFESRMMMIDRRDEEDRRILDSLKKGEIPSYTKEIDGKKQKLPMIEDFTDNFRKLLAEGSR